MIVRNIETCPACGQWDPWRKISSRLINRGNVVRRVYVKCRRCGCKETIVYSLPKTESREDR